MVDLVAAKCRCSKQQPSFGIPGGRAVCCTACKEPAMVDVKRPKCRCGKHFPSFGIPGHKPVCCSACKEPDMVNVKSPKCRCGKHCPSFGIPGRKPVCCAACKEPAMVDVTNPKCRCGKHFPSFGIPRRKPVCCSACKGPDMVSVIRSKCRCGKHRPYFGTPGHKPVCCAACKEPAMVDVTNPKCQCGKHFPSFGIPGHNPVCCSACKEPNMVHVSSPKCRCGKHRPSFGIPGHKPVCCAACKEPDMVDVANSRCGKQPSLRAPCGKPPRASECFPLGKARQGVQPVVKQRRGAVAGIAMPAAAPAGSLNPPEAKRGQGTRKRKVASSSTTPAAAQKALPKKMQPLGLSFASCSVPAGADVLRRQLIDSKMETAKVHLEYGDVANAAVRFQEILDLDPNHEEAKLKMQRCVARVANIAVKREHADQQDLSDDFLNDIRKKLCDGNNPRSPKNCAFLARAVIAALASGNLPDFPGAVNTVQLRHWTTWLEREDGLVISASICMQTSIPKSLEPFLSHVQHWISDSNGFTERDAALKEIQLVATARCDLRAELQQLAALGRAAFGLVFISGRRVGHVIAFYVGRSGSARFIDPHRRRGCCVADNLETMLQGSQLESSQVFYLVCSGQMADMAVSQQTCLARPESACSSQS
ncbi:unnamed protein product [Polarella glacialis]|uniref:Uncharacterized protein n=1 Tax=Polarella glacialis TaxID=89957 RepID=A0A813GBR9_POLGL|nr:unnamed protein product [Polarella glacialis]